MEIGTLFSPTAAGNVLPHLLLPLTQILAFALPPFPYRSHIFIPIIISLVFATWANLCSDDVALRSLMIGQWPWYLGTLEKLIFHPIPEKEYWRLDRPKAEAMSLPFLSKLKWSAALYCNPRGIGWNYEVNGIPKYEAPGTKTAFMIEQAKRLAVHAIILDAIHIWNSRSYYTPGVDMLTIDVRNTTLPIAASEIISWIGQVVSTSYLYTQVAMVSVLLGGGQPKDWPPLYGSLRDAYTLRRYWNTFWHQLTRHMLVSYTDDLKNLLRIPRGTWISSYFALYFGFFLSALFHGLVTYALPYGPYHTFHLRFYLWFFFMFVQAPAIHFEDCVIWCYKQATRTTDEKDMDERPSGRKDPATWQKVVGYIWVIFFWYHLVPTPANAVLRFGMVKDSPVPFSVLEPLLSLVENNLGTEKLSLADRKVFGNLTTSR
ncbi:hypothetical protein N7G274_005816 [Stereocaulon virgatum]|uniref:Wax synthase domain-containing protein n=1 Tax=Stereocaulon virgatum TaxID=373712 RepID=A0ABR4A9L0_9LECA